MTPRVLVLATLALASPVFTRAKPALIYDGPTGSVTAAELKAFKACMAEFTPAASNTNNAWVYGNSGQAIEALALVYELSGDTDFLNRMIELSDTALAERNDLAPPPVGQRIIWTGKISPVWPNRAPDLADAGYSATENGDIIGHIALTAAMILRHHELWVQSVPADIHHFGVTYLERAKTYVRQMDFSCQEFMIPNLVRASDRGRLYFPVDATYKNLSAPVAKAGQAVPWNQQFMITNGFQHLAECHELLGDAPELVKAYDGYVRESLAWFISRAWAQPDSKHGGVLYLWNYSLAEEKHIEDSNHTDIDLQGLSRAWASGRYGDVLHRSDMDAFANDNVDLMALGEGKWAGHVNGHSDTGHGSGTNYPRPNFLSMLEFRPDAYASYAAAEVASGHAESDFNVVSRLLWLKYRLNGKR